MSLNWAQIWMQINDIPAIWLAVTLAAFAVSDAIHIRAYNFPLLHPVLISVLMIIALLNLTGVSYQTYFDGAYPIHLLLGPATVALAVPLYANLQRIRDYIGPLLIALGVGSVVGIFAGLLIGHLLGLSPLSLISIAPKSVTTPIAMALAQHAGGNVSLAAGVVILTGICGAILATPLFQLLRIKDEVAQGFAMGMGAHGVGTSRAIQMSETTGAFAGLAMGLNGILTSLILPLMLSIWFYFFS
ncbi:LrgB family protein [Chitinibacter bivalviorum]|uniref:LrgB family protein n=1 Tax=Chitinibacter bivalviorum TaxID=2739434 RepID=A0A7H9BE97_9NEIS|nr:LrgB family protein [Chitinibacter bivalviorum]QLG86915.1 LrgB family protein [Chitinibacter bivalviorum]